MSTRLSERKINIYFNRGRRRRFPRTQTHGVFFSFEWTGQERSHSRTGFCLSVVSSRVMGAWVFGLLCLRKIVIRGDDRDGSDDGDDDRESAGECRFILFAVKNE